VGHGSRLLQQKERTQQVNMPGILKVTDGAVKRKRVASKEKPVKRARSESSEEDGQAHILLMENEIFESKKHYNNIPKLIKLVQPKENVFDESIIAAISLCRAFSRLMASGDMSKKAETTEKEMVVVLWLKERYIEYKNALLMLFQVQEAASTVLTLSMRVLKSEGTHMKNGQDYNFPSRFLTDLVRTLLSLEDGEDIRAEFAEKFVEEYDDVRFYTFEAIA
jgi:U3 small nucleolar RNA-associated protein 19